MNEVHVDMKVNIYNPFLHLLLLQPATDSLLLNCFTKG